MNDRKLIKGRESRESYGETLPHLMNQQNSVLFYADSDSEEDNDGSNQDKMKTMFMSLWNNVKYNFATKLKTRFSYESPIWLLGVCYHKRLNDSMNLSHQSQYRDDSHAKSTSIDKFKHDFYSRIWLTYRREFPKLMNSNLTSDCGWGCMLRTGQMILAQAFLTHYLSRHWRWSGPQSDKEDMIHRMIIKWFADDPNQSSSPFSVHQLVKFGEQIGKKPGDWFGPANVAHLLRLSLCSAATTNPVLGNICCYVANDCTVYIQDVINLCVSNTQINENRRSSLDKKQNYNLKSKNDNINNFSYINENVSTSNIDVGVIANEDLYCENKRMGSIRMGSSSLLRKPSLNSSSLLNYGRAPSTFNLSDTGYSSSSGPRSLPFSLPNSSITSSAHSTKWRGVLILVPVRLGSDRLNPIYVPCIKQLLTHPMCLGIIGGKPKHSLYFVGWQDEKLIYIDPHYCQQSVDVRQTNFPLDSFHCDFPRKTHFSYMDPSCALGFYCHSQEEFFEFINSVQDSLIPPNKRDYPIFTFNEGSNAYNTSISHDRLMTEKLLKVIHRTLTPDGKVAKETHMEEFVVL